MKRIYLILFIVLATLQLKAQLVYDEYGEVIPFSLTEKYIDIFRQHEIRTLLLPSLDNDSLCAVHNDGKKMYELGTQYTGGIDLDIKPINFKKVATKIELDLGTVWRYAIEGKTAEEIGITIKKPNLVPGSYLCIIGEGNSTIIQPPKIYLPNNLNERTKKFGISRSILGQKLIIELYEPKSVISKADFIINSVDYGFVPFEKW
jgi:hypothetical protein